MTVVHAVLTLGVGGLERMALALCRAGLARGQTPAIVCVEAAGELAAEAEGFGVGVHPLGKPPGRHPQVIDWAAELIARLKPAVVHTHQLGALWYLGPAARRLGIPVVHTEHGNPFARANGVVERVKLRLLARSAARSADRVAAVSAEIATALGRFGTVPKRKLVVVPNGIATPEAEKLRPTAEVRKELGVPHGAVLVGTVGRLAEVKRQDRLIETVVGLPGVWLCLVGDGSERTRLAELTVRHGVADRVQFVGYQSRPEEYLRAFDLFALTSRSEGFPVSLLEAWAAGRPVVATAVGGIPDVVTDGVDGLLVPPGDAAALRSAVARAVSDPDLRDRLGRAGRATLAAKYTLDRVADRYADLYADVLRGPG